MKKQDTPLGRAGFLVIPIGISLAFVFQPFLLAVGIGAGIGALIANIKAVLLISRARGAMANNPLKGLQAEIQGVDTSMQIRFIFTQSVIGAFVVATWTAAAAGIALLLR